MLTSMQQAVLTTMDQAVLSKRLLGAEDRHGHTVDLVLARSLQSAQRHVTTAVFDTSVEATNFCSRI